MYVQGVSTRKVREITEELCGHSFSASAVSAAAKRLDAELARFARRRLEVAFPYVFLDARYERVREGGVVQSRAVLVVIGVDEAGRRQVLAVELANRESASSWRDLLLGLKERGLRGVELAISDDHAGLKRAVMEVLPAAMWQRCYVHFLRNALDYCAAPRCFVGTGQVQWRITPWELARGTRRNLAKRMALSFDGVESVAECLHGIGFAGADAVTGRQLSRTQTDLSQGSKAAGPSTRRLSALCGLRQPAALAH
jgi:hypothetical protein